MSTSSDSAEQIVRLSLEGVEVVAKISGVAAKNIAVALYRIMQDQKKTKGKARLNSMIRSEKELKIFSIKKEDLKTFYQEAKSYGILYCALVNRKNKNVDDMVDIMVRAEDAAKVNRIVDRYNLCTIDKALIEREIEKDKTINMAEKELTDNVKEVVEEKADISEKMIDDIFSKPIMEDKKDSLNPDMAKTEKSPPSEHSSMSRNNSEGVPKSAEKKSVRKELAELRAEKKVEMELKEAQKQKGMVELGGTVQTPKLPNKERSK